jgi:hypothetical protein
VDFWAQHKDFILKILAGVGIFLVVLLARSITYGDELEREEATNRSLKAKISSTQVAKESEIQALQQDAERLKANAKALTEQIGWNLDDKALESTLLRRILRYTRTYAKRSDADVQRAVDDFRAGLNDDLNSGFGQLRIKVGQDLVEEAKQKGIKVDEGGEGVAFATVTNIEPNEKLQYLMQLELVSRFARAAIDAPVDAIDSVRITGSERREPPIPGANPEFFNQYQVEVRFTASANAARAVVNHLEDSPPQVPIVGLHVDRVKRPVDHISVDLKLLATAADPSKPFEVK